MAAKGINYSKWDNIELSDDDDIEVHPNIDKASWIRWKQQDIHRKREERKFKIASLKQEHSTNKVLRGLILKASEDLKNPESGRQAATEILKNVVTYERERKDKLFDPESEEYLKPRDEQEVFAMLLSRLLTESKVECSLDALYTRLPQILVDEVPKLDKRQQEVLRTIAEEEAEANKKMTSDNMYKEGFSKTILNKEDSTKKSLSPKKDTAIEVLNPGYANVGKTSTTAPSKETIGEEGLRELSLHEEQLLLNFAKITSFEDSYKYIQQHKEIVSREMSDQLMARAFRLQMKGQAKESRLCAKWSLAISYSMQMGTDGVGLFYKRLINGGPQPQEVFETDVEATYTRIRERTKILAEKEKDKEYTSENSNLTPEQAVAFKSFPKHFQEALMSNDIDQINKSFSLMGEEKAAEVMALCQKTELISVLSDEEAKKYQEPEKK